MSGLILWFEDEDKVPHDEFNRVVEAAREKGAVFRTYRPAYAPEQAKLCDECHWSENFAGKGLHCKHPMSVGIAFDNRIMVTACADMREEGAMCGPNGAYWKSMQEKQQ